MSYSEAEFRSEIVNILYNMGQNMQNYEFQDDMYYQVKEMNENLSSCSNQLQRIADSLEEINKKTN